MLVSSTCVSEHSGHVPGRAGWGAHRILAALELIAADYAKLATLLPELNLLDKWGCFWHGQTIGCPRACEVLCVLHPAQTGADKLCITDVCDPALRSAEVREKCIRHHIDASVLALRDAVWQIITGGTDVQDCIQSVRSGLLVLTHTPDSVRIKHCQASKLDTLEIWPLRLACRRQAGAATAASRHGTCRRRRVPAPQPEGKIHAQSVVHRPTGQSQAALLALDMASIMHEKFDVLELSAHRSISGPPS